MPVKLISESQFQRGFILRASGFAGVSFVADGGSDGFDGVSHGFVRVSHKF